MHQTFSVSSFRVHYKALSEQYFSITIPEKTNRLDAPKKFVGRLKLLRMLSFEEKLQNLRDAK